MPQLKHIFLLLPLAVVATFAACELKVDKPVADHGDKPAAPTTNNDVEKPEPQVPGTAKPTPAPPAPKLSLATILTADKTYFRTDDGTKQFQFKPKEADAVKFYDADGAEICKLTMHPDKLKVKSAADEPLFELKWHGDKISFKDAADKELSKLRFHGADFEFVASEKTVAKIIHEDGGNYRVEDAAGMKIATLTAEGGHAHYASADGAHKLSCDKTANPLAMAGFALPDLTPPQQAAVFIYFVSRPAK